MKIKDNKNVSILLAFIPVLAIYSTGLPGLSLSDLILVLFGFFAIIQNQFKFIYFRSFALYSFILTIFSFLLLDNDFSLAIVTCVSFLMYIFMYNTVVCIKSYEWVIKGIQCLAIISSAFFIFQYILMKSTGIIIPGIISFLPLSNNVDTANFISVHAEMTRLSSIFEEPARFCEFMYIALVIQLFHGEITKKKLIIALIYSFCMISSTSALGAAVMVFAWSSFLFLRVSVFKEHKFLTIIMAASFIILSVSIFAASFTKYSIVSRFSQMTFTPEKSDHGFSTYIRTIRGYIPFVETGNIRKLFGNGIGSIYSFVQKNPNSDFMWYVDYLVDYLNTIQYLLFYTGVAGFCLFFKDLIRYIRRAAIMTKVLMYGIIIQMFGCGIIFSPCFILAFYLLIVYKDENYYNSSNIQCG